MQMTVISAHCVCKCRIVAPYRTAEHARRTVRRLPVKNHAAGRAPSDLLRHHVDGHVISDVMSGVTTNARWASERTPASAERETVWYFSLFRISGTRWYSQRESESEITCDQFWTLKCQILVNSPIRLNNFRPDENPQTSDVPFFIRGEIIILEGVIFLGLQNGYRKGEWMPKHRSD